MNETKRNETKRNETKTISGGLTVAMPPLSAVAMVFAPKTLLASARRALPARIALKMPAPTIVQARVSAARTEPAHATAAGLVLTATLRHAPTSAHIMVSATKASASAPLGGRATIAL